MEIFLGLIEIILVVYSVIYPKKRKIRKWKKIKFLFGYISVINDPNNKRLEPIEKNWFNYIDGKIFKN